MHSSCGLHLIVRFNSSIFFTPPPPPSSLPADSFDVVLIVGALSVGQVPAHVVRELCKSAKPGENMLYAVSTAALTYCCKPISPDCAVCSVF